MQILIPSDFSPAAASALDWAAGLGAQLGAQLMLLHVIPFDDGDSSLPLPGPSGSDEEVDRRGEEAAVLLVHAAQKLRECHPELTIDWVVRCGVPWREICRVAESAGSGLIVVASRQRRGMTGWLLGNTAERVSRYAGCPVVTVPEKTS